MADLPTAGFQAPSDAEVAEHMAKFLAMAPLPSAVFYATSDAAALELVEQKNKMELLTSVNEIGQTALHSAATRGFCRTATKLLDVCGAELLMKLDNDGQTALHHAANCYKRQLSEMLLNFAASQGCARELLAHRSKGKQIAADMARQNASRNGIQGHMDLARWLEVEQAKADGYLEEDVCFQFTVEDGQSVEEKQLAALHDNGVDKANIVSYVHMSMLDATGKPVDELDGAAFPLSFDMTIRVRRKKPDEPIIVVSLEIQGDEDMLLLTCTSLAGNVLARIEAPRGMTVDELQAALAGQMQTSTSALQLIVGGQILKADGSQLLAQCCPALQQDDSGQSSDKSQGSSCVLS